MRVRATKGHTLEVVDAQPWAGAGAGSRAMLARGKVRQGKAGDTHTARKWAHPDPENRMVGAGQESQP